MSEKRQSPPSAIPRKKLKTEAGSVNVQEVGEEDSEEVFRGQVDIEPSQPENTIIEAKDSLKEDRDHVMADGSVPENLLQDQIISSPKKGRITCVGFEGDPAMAVELRSEEDSVQDQTIIAPEIMSLILEQLDLRTLKQVRLVCKSWLVQAQYHLLRRGIVHLSDGTLQSLCYAGIPKFASVCQKRIRALPLPFQFVNADFQAVFPPPPAHPFAHLSRPSSRFEETRFSRIADLQEVPPPPPALIVTYLFSLPPPLAVTRFSQGPLSVHLAIGLIVQCSSTLEYLQLSLESSDGNKVSPAKMNVLQQLSFQKLRHLNVDATVLKDTRRTCWTQFPSIVACISKNSPNFETYESKCQIHVYAKKLVNQLALQVDIKNVKNLTLSGYELNTVAFNHVLSIPFAQLQCLKMEVKSEGSETNTEALAATVTKCANSLTTLDLSFNAGNIADLKLPVCPNVRELTLHTLKESDGGILPFVFPALQVVNVHRIGIDLDRKDDWDSFPPLFDLQTLRIRALRQFYHGYRRVDYGWRRSGCMGHGGYRDNRSPWKYDSDYESVWTTMESDSSSSKQLITFFEKFPGLERLCIPSSNVIGVCEDIRDKKCCSNLLDGVKHLELCGKDYDYSPLAVLKGIETITMMNFNDSVPVRDLPCLKLLQFPWGDYLKMNTSKLMEIASRVARVAVTNCCSFPRTGDAQSKKLLETFFELASNAECGCKDGKKIPEMML